MGPVARLPYSSHNDFENFIEPVSSTNPEVELGSKDTVFEDRVGFNVLAVTSSILRFSDDRLDSFICESLV